MEEAVKALTRITLNPDVMGGKPCIRGLRVTVGTIIGLMASGYTIAAILELYPYLEEEDIRAALPYAAWRVSPDDPLEQVMHEIGRDAQERGLTPEILESILYDVHANS
jgi:uncharacterized protein (DUF433 family)